MATYKSVPDAAGIEKMPTGIRGFDAITGGGLPRGGTTVLLGPPGCGKTVFALQTLVVGVRQFAEPGIFVAFEENSTRIMRNATTFGWDLPSLAKEDLFFLDARVPTTAVTTGQFDLSGLLAGVAYKANELHAKRVVFDSLDVLLARLDNPLLEQQEILRVHEWLATSGLTAIVTVKDDAGSSLSQRFSFMQFMADCVVLLQHRTQDRVSLRELQVTKYRGSSFSENEFPMIIGRTGITVAGSETSEADYPIFTERISTGIVRLDTMLGGGYYRGTSVLITGVPGTAKSTLGAAFVEAACLRGERALYVSFDEGSRETVRNMESVGIHLKPLVEAGILRMYRGHSAERSAEEHLAIVAALIDEHKPRCMVVDPLSGMLKAGGRRSAMGVAQRFLHLTKIDGITFVGTSLLEEGMTQVESSPIEVSTIADTWIHLSYVIRSGERNRALTIVKSRGTQHSNQVRELLLSEEGLTLADVYSAGGEVLMGTLRHEKETAERAEQERIQAETVHKRQELQRQEAETDAKIQVLQRDLEIQRARLQELDRDQDLHGARVVDDQQERLRLRSTDNDSPTASQRRDMMEDK